MTNTNARIACPRCRSNNFLGTTHCWQCGASLPPPEAVGGHPVSPFPTPVDNTTVARPRPSSRFRAWIVVAPLLLIVVLVIGYTASRSLRNGGRAGTDDLKAQVEALKKQIGSSPDVSASGSAEESPDVAAAKREMERLRSQYGLVPPTDASGNVHLQGGGTVTREQYQRALDSLNRSSGGR